MRQVAKKGLTMVVATGGVLAVTTGLAHADAGAQGAAVGSPGVLSGNQVQVPVHAPVNVCGNTVDVVGVLNPASGNNCGNASSQGGGGAAANGTANGSPGIGSGNVVQAPVHAPVNVCGNTVDVVGVLNPASGNGCGNTESTPDSTAGTSTPAAGPLRYIPRHTSARHIAQPHRAPDLPPFQHHQYPRGWESGSPQLANTGADTLGLAAIPVSAGLLIGGVLLYRRGRRAAARV